MVSDGAIYSKTLRSSRFGPLTEVISSSLLDDFILSLTIVRGAVEQLLMKASREAVIDPEGEILDADNGFGESDEDDIQGSAPTFSQPRGVTDGDWRVYEVLDGLHAELYEKFRAIWF